MAKMKLVIRSAGQPEFTKCNVPFDLSTQSGKDKFVSDMEKLSLLKQGINNALNAVDPQFTPAEYVKTTCQIAIDWS